jgi:hypothetical protein
LSKKRPTDVNQLAHFLVGQTTEDHEETKTAAAPMPTKSDISRIMAAMGRKGGKKSAKARMGPNGIPPEKRSEIALRAAKARWAAQEKNPG